MQFNSGYATAQDDEAPKRQSFVQRKVNRVNRKPPTRTTTEASFDEEDGDIKTMSKCPEPHGFFADAEQCDKYYACVDGDMTEKLCPDGMVFNDYSSNDEKCDLPFNIDCSKRSKYREYYHLISSHKSGLVIANSTSLLPNWQAYQTIIAQ